jgi:phosphoribosylamine--glycine ligase
MKILLIGSGGREHALLWKISQSRKVDKIYSVPGNSKMGELSELVDIKASDIISIADFAEEKKVDLTVVGPELPLSLGIVDEFKQRGLKIYGPTQKAAELETSKVFCKNFLDKHNIPTAKYRVFSAAAEAIEYLSKLDYPVVVKADGLAGGKGAYICQDLKQAKQAVKEMMLENKFGTAGDRVVVEEFLVGSEMSFIVVSDGKRVIPMVTSMDYKKLGEKDKGPNTGGMGAISPAPQITKKLYNRIMKEIIIPVIEGMNYEGREFRGTLYAGLMITSKGPRVLEFNCRFGDPETQAVMLRLESDIIDILDGSAEGSLFEVDCSWSSKVSCCVVLASRGYPGKYETGKKIDGLKRAIAQGVEVFHAGTRLDEGDFFTAGGRVLNVCALDDDLKNALKKAYDAISFINFENLYYRKDIGREENEV